MKKAIIIHGYVDKEEFDDINQPSPSNNHWIPWLREQLALQGFEVETPEMPVPYEPVYEDWAAVFEQLEPNEETLLVGHSCGGGFLVRWLSEHPEQKVGKVVLVAPWLDPNGLIGDFFKFDINPKITAQTKKLTIFYSTDDEEEVLASTIRLRRVLNDIDVREFTDKGHFVIDDLGTEEFPELFAWSME